MRIAIIIPAYNEEKRIGPTLEAYCKYLDDAARKDKFDYEMLVVVNNTTDKTEEIVKSAEKKHRRIKHITLVQGGKGYAVVEGFKKIIRENFDLVGFVDSDMSTKPDAYYDLIKKIKDNDGVIASRYVHGAAVYPKQTLARIISSRVFNFMIRVLFFLPYQDTQCGAKLFRAKLIKKMVPSLSMSQWAFDVELLYLARKNGGRIIEIPTVWSDAEYSKIRLFKAGPGMMFGILRLRLLHSPVSKVVSIFGDYFFNKVPKPYKTEHPNNLFK